MSDSHAIDQQFEPLRGRLFGIAYRMLASRAEAEDVVQDAYLRWHQADRDAIRNPEAWLVTTATRLAIDRLRALNTERRTYQGPWLPEPIMTDAPPPDRQVELAADLSVAFLVLLERLGPEERAAFLLREVFDCDYGTLASTLGRSEASCRQMVHRARERLRSDRKRFEVSHAAKTRLLKQFMAAMEAQDEQALRALFAPDAAWTADGGGRVPAAPYPILGADRIAQLLIGLQERFFKNGTTLHLVVVNGEPGVCVRMDGRVIGVVSIDSDGERILNAYAVVNPEKLAGVPVH